MASQRYVSTSFWTDKWVEESLSIQDRYLYLYLLTNPLTNIAGVYKITDRRMQFETGLDANEIDSSFAIFASANKAHRFNEYVILPKWPRHQKVKSARVLKGIVTCLSELSDETLQFLGSVEYELDLSTIEDERIKTQIELGNSKTTGSVVQSNAESTTQSNMREEEKDSINKIDKPHENRAKSEKTDSLFSVENNSGYVQNYLDSDLDSDSDIDLDSDSNLRNMSVSRGEKTDCSSEKTEKKRKRVNYPDDFQMLWKAWPGGGSKKEALKEYKKATEDANYMIGVIQAQIEFKERQRKAGEFVEAWPHLCRWIKHERWNDKLVLSGISKTGEMKKPQAEIACVYTPDGRKTYPEFKDRATMESVMAERGYVHDGAKNCWHKDGYVYDMDSDSYIQAGDDEVGIADVSLEDIMSRASKAMQRD